MADDKRPVSMAFFKRVLEILGPEVRNAIEKRAKPIEARIALIESRKGVEYRGTWRSDSEYGLNDLATHSGCLWICRAQGTRKKPGDGDAWHLCSKRDLAP